ncbi:MAG: family 43 glycosylhydrolase [Puniceicoccales bacterium]|nr:family 43 glycosylhydrolase [Puniceicoccales bacterium]
MGKLENKAARAALITQAAVRIAAELHRSRFVSPPMRFLTLLLAALAGALSLRPALDAAKPIERQSLKRHFFMLDKGETRVLPAGPLYTSSDPKVATVAGNRLQAAGEGECEIFALEPGSKRTSAAAVAVGWPVQNPVLPFSWNLYVPDTEAHNFAGAVYIYGSLDADGGSYCSPYYLSLFSRDIRRWESKGVSFSSFQEGVPHRGRILWDSDGFFDRASGKFLHYGFFADTMSGRNNHMFVVEGNSPTGPFSNFRWLTGDKSGNKVDGISAQVFEDTDGVRYITYAPTAHVHPSKNYPVIARLRDITTVDEASAVNVGAQVKDFYEGPSLRKRGDTYYLVYAENTGRITDRNRRPVRLSYATAKNIFGPYTYRGIIVSIEDMPGDSNIQGSIEEHGGQWYVFYHRSLNGPYNRRALCVEKINFDADGRIGRVEPTSSGVAEGLDTARPIWAGTAVIFKNVRRGEFGDFGGVELGGKAGNESLLGFRYVLLTGKEQQLAFAGANLGNIRRARVFADGKLLGEGDGTKGIKIENAPAGKTVLTLTFETAGGPRPVVYSAKFAR